MMEDALRQTLKALREERGLGLEAMANGIAGMRAQDSRKHTIAHTTIRDLEMGTAKAPRGGWNELVTDYAMALDITPDDIWRAAISRYEAEAIVKRAEQAQDPMK